MKRKGFAITGILYVLLIIFLASMTMLLFNLQNRKMILDQLKLDVVEAVESENNYEYLLNKISELDAKIGNTNSLNGTIVENIKILESDFTLSNREKVQQDFNIPSSQSYSLYTYKAPHDGIYFFTGTVTFASNSNGTRSLSTRFNETTNTLQIGASPSWATHLPIYMSHYLKEGETVEFSSDQTSGSTLAVTFKLLIESSE